MTSNYTCEICGAISRENGSPCKNCEATNKRAGHNHATKLGGCFWISALIGLFTSWLIGGFAIYGDAGTTTPGVVVTVVAVGTALQIGSWYLGRLLIRRGHPLVAWIVLAIPFAIVLLLLVLFDVLISKIGSF